MTGELTLHGKILRTGGIKEKVLLARREEISDVIIPAENEPDVSMLADNIREGITFHFVSDFAAVYALLFPQQTPLTVPQSLPLSTRAEAVL
jgi:ATP-dependent Lon protease